MNFYELTVPQFIRMLNQIHRWLDKAQAFADQKKFDVDVLMGARLAPDMFPLVKQIQVVTDQAKGAAARLSGTEPPKYEDNEKTLAEVRARIDKTIAYLKTFKPEQFQGAADRIIQMPFAPTKGMKGSDFLVGMVFTNFYFHATTTYAILRHNGVDLGKMDFLGDVPMRDL